MNAFMLPNEAADNSPTDSGTKPVFPGACDCHVHVFGDRRRFPMHPDRAFTPAEASIIALQQHLKTTGMSRVVIVQPSVYFTDNACTEDAIRTLGPAARGICVVDTSCSEAELQRLNTAGFRGVRFNLRTTGSSDAQRLTTHMRILCDPLSELGWHIQCYCDALMLDAMLPLMQRIQTPLVLDHFAGVGTMRDDAMKTLLALLDTGNVYLKLSAPERVADAAGERDLAEMVRYLSLRYPTRLLWGSDWPHPGNLDRGPRNPSEIEPFRAVDDRHVLHRLVKWLDDGQLVRTILVDNPEKLYGFASPAIS